MTSTSLFHSLSAPFAEHEKNFIGQWERACGETLPLQSSSQDQGRLYRSSHSILRAHEDKNYSGDKATPLRALIHLAVAQRADGGFHQNFWLDGSPYWSGVQLDEVAFPVLLARKLHNENALGDYDPYPMVRSAAAYPRPRTSCSTTPTSSSATSIRGR